MSHIESITHIKATYVNHTHEKENKTYSEWKDHITKWNNEYIKCNDRGLQTTELSTWTINNDSELNWTQQNKKNHGELKSGLNKTEMTLMMTIIKMRSTLSWTTAKWCTHVDWTKSSTWDISKYHTTISTINIQINLLKTRRMEYCMCRICRQGIDGHTWFRQVDQPSINQILYGMSECRAIICCMSLSLMKWTMLMWAEMRRNRKRQGAWCQRNNQTNIFELLKSSSQSHAQRNNLSAYGLGGGWVVALGCGGRGCMLVWAM